MHKGVILLTKAENKEDAQSNVEQFLEPYGNDIVWDWYVIGGRWSGTLNKNRKEFNERARKLFKNKDFISMKDVEKNKDKLQKIWEDLGETSLNPKSRINSFNGNDKDNTNDIMKAKYCKPILKEWVKDMVKEAEKFWEKVLEERKKEVKRNSMSMSGYYAGLYGKCLNDEFSFESNVYDIVEYTNKLPKSLKGYFAVMVDMHT